jgi:hypothetical protein
MREKIHGSSTRAAREVSFSNLPISMISNHFICCVYTLRTLAQFLPLAKHLQPIYTFHLCPDSAPGISESARTVET